MYTLLSADIGASHCRFALFQANRDDPGAPMLRLLREQWLAGAEYPSFREALLALRAARVQETGEPFLPDDPKLRPAIAVLAPAGPIEGDRCRMSNLSWLIQTQDLREELGIATACLINDFVAQAYACLLPDSIDLSVILPGQAEDNAPKAVTGAGTGFGQALILPNAAFPAASQDMNAKAHEQTLRRLARAVILPSEGGHCDFPFTGKDELALADFIRQSTGLERIINDTLVSGSGLAHIFAFLTGERLPAREVPACIDSCPQALEWYARFYGRACRGYTLSSLALGGLYVTGGMALRVPVLTHPAFAEELHHSQAQRRLLQRIPVYHVRTPEAGLWGAALYGMLRL
ncbi:MAG: glucokinase [Desulfovibrio sp.]|nr:glucokinase [Desulfovibrio sp.]